MNGELPQLPDPPNADDGRATVRITPTGLAVLWCTTGLLLVGAFRFDAMLLLLGGLGMAGLGMARWWAPRNIDGIRVERELPAHVFAGDAFEIAFTLGTGPERRLDAFAIGVRDELLPQGERNLLLASRVPARGGTASGRLRTRLFRRGIERRQRYELLSIFPLGLFESRVSGSLEMADDSGLIVYPRPLLPDALRRELDLARFEIANPHGLEPEQGGDFRGVRAWRPGDSLRSIHWPATARIGSMLRQQQDGATFSTLMVREWDPPGPRPQRFGIVFHSLSAAGNLIRPDRFELALRITAGLLIYCRDAGIPLRFVSPFPGLSDSASDMVSIPDRADIHEALARLAVARRIPCRNPREVSATIGRLADCERIFAVSDADARNWKHVVAGPGRRVVCVDSESMKVERPRVKVKRRRREVR